MVIMTVMWYACDNDDDDDDDDDDHFHQFLLPSILGQ